MDLSDPDQLVLLSDVAKKFRVSTATAIKWHKAGVKQDETGEPIRLHAIRPGRMKQLAVQLFAG